MSERLLRGAVRPYRAMRRWGPLRLCRPRCTQRFARCLALRLPLPPPHDAPAMPRPCAASKAVQCAVSPLPPLYVIMLPLRVTYFRAATAGGREGGLRVLEEWKTKKFSDEWVDDNTVHSLRPYFLQAFFFFAF